MTDWLGSMELDDLEPAGDLLLPPPPRSGRGTRRPVFMSLHAAYHQLSRRLEWLLDEAGTSLSATEAAVLVAAAAIPGGAIALSRRDTGIHPSTMTSVLDRLERRGYITRERGAEDHRFVALWTTPAGRHAADQARAALAELDQELRVHVNADDLEAMDEVSDAAGAIAPRGTLPDY
jgi:MarR family transcriptional repressor of emrRAB